VDSYQVKSSNLWRFRRARSSALSSRNKSREDELLGKTAKRPLVV
jgi:hypothetical protein